MILLNKGNNVDPDHYVLMKLVYAGPIPLPVPRDVVWEIEEGSKWKFLPDSKDYEKKYQNDGKGTIAVKFKNL